MRYLLPALLLVWLPLMGHSQTLELKDLKTPTSPGFILMDKTPESIDKPATPAALGVSILNLSNGGAFEVTPYWLTAKKNLTYKKFANRKVPILQTASLSVATQIKTDTAYLGVGVRFNILRLRSSNNKDRLKAEEAELDSFLNEDITIPIQDSIKQHGKKLVEYIEQPTWLVTLAGAYLGQSDNEKFKNIESSRVGIWMTVSYFDTHFEDFRLLILNRYLRNPNFSGYEKDSEFYDLGLSLAFQKKKFGASLEYVNRMGINNSDNYNRLSGLIEIKLMDNLYLSGTLGKNFDEERDLFVLFGANIGVNGKSSFVTRK